MTETSAKDQVENAQSPAIFGLVNPVGWHICYANSLFQVLLQIPVVLTQMMQIKSGKTRQASLGESLRATAAKFSSASAPFTMNWIGNAVDDSGRTMLGMETRQGQCAGTTFMKLMERFEKSFCQNLKAVYQDMFKSIRRVRYECFDCSLTSKEHTEDVTML